MRGLLDAIWYLREKGYSIEFTSKETERGRFYKVSLTRPSTEGVLMMPDDVISRARKLKEEEERKKANRAVPVPFSGDRVIGFNISNTRKSKGYLAN